MMAKLRDADGHVVFATTIGPCGIAWSPRGLVRIQLPEDGPEATLRRLVATVALPDGGGSTTPPAVVQAAINRIIRHLTGKEAGLERILLDLEGIPPFHRKVYEAARRIASGTILTYGELAANAGSPMGARAVGQAMAKNPVPIVVPCHRVIAASGRPGGFSSFGGLDTKAHLLAIEGASLPTPPKK
jgi:methylated-DNA-[protein]-cysteine S-methyltransferase